MNSLFFSIIYKKFSFWSAISLSISRIHYEFTVCFGNSFLINYSFREFTIDLLSFLEFTLNPISVSWVRHLFRENAMNSLSLSRIHYELTIHFANSPWIHCLYREFTKNTIDVTRIHF